MKPSAKIVAFKDKLLAWYAEHKRDLPFRGEKDPYRIWVSEVLLQQTQASRGAAYYVRFIKRFPTVQSLAKASWEQFLPYFRGLGFYNRGRNMLRAARFVMDEYGGSFPNDHDRLRRIPGVGPYTANAIRSFSYDQPVLTLDTNVRRIVGRVFGVGVHPTAASPAGADARRAGSHLPAHRDTELTALTKKIEHSLWSGESAALNQAMMDLGSSLCSAKRPACGPCPLRGICSYGQSTAREPLPKVALRAPSRQRLPKYPVALVHWQGRVLLLPDGKLPGGRAQGIDERAFLKYIVGQRWSIEISVRPAFLTWEGSGVRYSIHRCHVLSGEPPDGLPSVDKASLTTADALDPFL